MDRKKIKATQAHDLSLLRKKRQYAACLPRGVAMKVTLMLLHKYYGYFDLFRMLV